MERSPKEWELSAENASKAQFSKFQKSYPREYASLFANLNKINNLLESGHKIGGFRVDFFRSEGGDVYRIGQTGVPSAKESRLYVFPDQHNRIMHVLGVGTKDTQDGDITNAKDVVRRIRQSREAKQ